MLFGQDFGERGLELTYSLDGRAIFSALPTRWGGWGDTGPFANERHGNAVRLRALEESINGVGVFHI